MKTSHLSSARGKHGVRGPPQSKRFISQVFMNIWPDLVKVEKCNWVSEKSVGFILWGPWTFYKIPFNPSKKVLRYFNLNPSGTVDLIERFKDQVTDKMLSCTKPRVIQWWWKLVQTQFRHCHSRGHAACIGKKKKKIKSKRWTVCLLEVIKSMLLINFLLLALSQPLTPVHSLQLQSSHLDL